MDGQFHPRQSINSLTTAQSYSNVAYIVLWHSSRSLAAQGISSTGIAFKEGGKSQCPKENACVCHLMKDLKKKSDKSNFCCWLYKHGEMGIGLPSHFISVWFFLDWGEKIKRKNIHNVCFFYMNSFRWASANSLPAHSAARISIQNMTFFCLLPAVERLFIALHFVLPV